MTTTTTTTRTIDNNHNNIDTWVLLLPESPSSLQQRGFYRRRISKSKTSKRRFNKQQTKLFVINAFLLILVIHQKSHHQKTNIANTSSSSSLLSLYSFFMLKKGCCFVQSFSFLAYHRHHHYYRRIHYQQLQLQRHRHSNIFQYKNKGRDKSAIIRSRRRRMMSSSSSIEESPEAMNNNSTSNDKTTKSNNNNNNKKKNLVIVLAGPTATGKSDVAARLCSTLKGIIVSADSVQAYKGVQIGANKPTPVERNQTPHLLIDIANHKDNYNAAEWRNDALLAINSLLCLTSSSSSLEEDNDNVNRNPDDDDDDDSDSQLKQRQRKNQILTEIKEARIQKGYTNLDEPILPVVCGGTMMYITWLVHGIPDVMKPSPEAINEAAQIITQFQNSQNDYKGAVQYVSNFGKVYENRTETFCGEDWYRLRRTLEVALTVKQQQQQNQSFNDSNNNRSSNNKQQLNNNKIEEALYTGERQNGLLSDDEDEEDPAGSTYDVRCFFLCPSDRMEHTKIVDERCEQMIIRGLLKETAQLSLADKFPDMASRAIGYRQAIDYLIDTTKCSQTNSKEGFTSFLNEFTTATRRYAKKQMSWFRKDPNFMFVSVNLEIEDKTKRIDDVATKIMEYCQLSPSEFQQQLKSNESDSFKCKTTNENQGKKMKFYQFERRHLIDGTKELDDAINEGIKYGIQMQQQQQKQQIDNDTTNNNSNTSSRKRKKEGEELSEEEEAADDKKTTS